jgi:uncharacterized alkaline shock family protein YloU
MAMSDTPEPGSLSADGLDGHTIDELSDYLDAGRSPRDEHIENSPGCLIALDALARLRATTWAMLEAEAAAAPGRDTAWIGKVLSNISREARAGRDIPISDPDPHATLSVTEGSIRGLVRAAGDGVGGALVGRCELVGDVTVPGEPISVSVTASVVFGENMREVAQRMRGSILEALARHTELTIASVDVTVQDILMPRQPRPEDPR